MDPIDRPSGVTRRQAALGLLAAGLWPRPGFGQTPPAEGGIGGTGIVGLISGAGGLSVNGRLLTVSRRTRLSGPNGRLSPTDLRAGDSATVEADGLADGRMRARRITISVPLVGAVVQRGGGLRVNGVAVTGPRAVLAAAKGRVTVHGLWRGDRVVASRIEAAEAGPDRIAGALRAGPQLGGVGLDFASARAVPAVGQYVDLAGRFDGRRFAVSEVRRERFQEPERLRFLSVQGYLEPAPTAPGFIVSGLGHSFDRDARLAALAGRRALIEGAYAGAFRAANGLILPEAPRARAELLAARRAGRAPGIALR